MSAVFIFALGLLAHAAGTLDTSFSGDGKTTVDFGFARIPFPYHIVVSDVAVQADGKTVVAGTWRPLDGDTGKQWDFAVARFNLDGTLDTSFGDFGSPGIAFSHPGKKDSNDIARAVAIQGDGKIVVAGEAVVSNFADFDDSQFAVVRFNPDGSNDDSFSGNGVRTIEFDVGAGARDVAIKADGSIVLVGYAFEGRYSISRDFAAVILTSDGSLAHKNEIGMGGDDIANAVTFDSTGSIIVVGQTDAGPASFAILKLDSNLNGDPTFDGDGKLLSPFRGVELGAANAVVAQGSGKFVVVGGIGNGVVITGIGTVSPSAPAMVRYLPDGRIDTTFGGAGTGVVAPNDLNFFTDVIASANGGLICGGDIFLSAFTADGIRITDFGTSGDARVHTSGAVRALAKGPGRRFVVTGDDFITVDGIPGFVELATVERYLDAGANVVHATPLGDPSGGETRTGLTPDPASFFVFREERLPFATRVFFNIGGTARFSPFFGSDYQLGGMNVSGTPFVDIPANQTYTLVTLQPIDDTLVEGTETAVFTIQPAGTYEIGAPSSAELSIRDNDFYLTSVTPQGTLKVGSAVVTPSAADLPANGKITFHLTWTTPGVWRDLATIEFRIVDEFGQNVLAWILWDETTNEISLRDPETGLFTEESGQPGSNQKLKAGDVELDLRNSTVVGSGPTGPSVTLTLALKLKSKTPGGLTGPLIYPVEVFASDDDGDQQGFDEVGALLVP